MPLLGDGDDTPPSLVDSCDDEAIDGLVPEATAVALVPEGLGGRMVGVPALPLTPPPPRCLGGGMGDTASAPVPAAADPDDVLVLLLVGPLFASNLGGRTGVTTASVIASMGARIHVATSLQSGLWLAEDDAAALLLELLVLVLVEVVVAAAGAGSGAASRMASSLLIILLGPTLISKRETSTSSLPSRVKAASAKALSVKVTGGDSSILLLLGMPKGLELDAPLPAERRPTSARKDRWMGGVTSKL